MSHFLDRLTYFSQPKEPFSGEYGVTTGEDRTWEDAYRDRWAHDKIVRSTHGVNCTSSCSWKIYVKGGIVTWETQQTDYPRTRWDMPNHEPRGCARGASYSWYVPPLSPISAAANAGHIGTNGEIPDVKQLRIPVKYLANLLTAGDTQPVERALERMLAMRAYLVRPYQVVRARRLNVPAGQNKPRQPGAGV